MSQAPYQTYQGQQGPPPAMYQPQQQPYPPQQQGYPPQQQGYPPQQQQGYPPPQQQPYPPQQGYPPQQPPMGSPHQPPQVPQQASPPATLNVNYLSGGCGMCGQQPGRRSGMAVLVDGQEVGKMEQGQNGTYFIAGGAPHMISAKVSGIGGFFRGLTGNDGAGQVAVTAMPAQSVHVWMGWESDGCCSSKWHPVIRQGQH